MATSPERSHRGAPIQSPLRTPEEVARRLRVSRDTVIEYYEARELEGVDLSPNPAAGNRLLRFDDDAVDRFIALRRRPEPVMPRPRKRRPVRRKPR